MSLVEIKDFNELIDNKLFCGQSVKTNKKLMKNVVMSRNDNYTTGNLLGYPYCQIYYQLVGIDLPRFTSKN